MIQKQTATVYFAPTKNRRYFSLEAAIDAEARAQIFRRYPYESGGGDGPDFDFPVDCPDEYVKMKRRLKNLLRLRYKEKAPTERNSAGPF